MASEGMTNERLTELTTQFGDAVSDLWNADPDQNPRDDAYDLVHQCWDELLAELERLRAREAALVAEREQAMAVARRVAASADGNMVMCLCGKSEWLPSATTIAWPVERSMVLHVPDCVFAQARALLASTAEGSDGDGAD